jgi:hypothetical protein
MIAPPANPTIPYLKACQALANAMFKPKKKDEGQNVPVSMIKEDNA